MVGRAAPVLEHRWGELGVIPVEAYRPFDIASITTREGIVQVVESRVASLRFGELRSFSRPNQSRRRALIVAPLAGGYPVLLRDLLIGLLRELGEVAITDWPDAR